MGRKIFNVVMSIFAIFIVATMAAYFIHKNADAIDRIFIHESVIDTQTDQFETDSTVVMTVQDFLEFRKEVIECNRVDSVFLTIPEPILVCILESFGTDLSNHEIVYIYESNIPSYNNILKGANTQKYIY